ncbi:MAG: PKD domain-containing protein, partial [Microthrixaceae bacterium]
WVVTANDSLTTYSIAPGTDDQLSIWRNTCQAPGGVVGEMAELLTDLDANATGVVCDTARGKDSEDQEDSCPRVTMRLGTNTSRRATISAMIRSDWVTEQRGIDNPDDRTPLVSLSATPTKGERGLTVQFSSEGSSDPQGENLTYQWEFGDSRYSDAPNPTHTFDTLGTYSAVLTVTNASGLAGSSFVVIGVVNRAPVATISSPPTDTSRFRGESISFSSAGSNDSADPAHSGTIVAYSWDFGDGTSSNEANPSKSYSSVSPSGGFRVALTVTDEDGGQARTETRVNIANRQPSVAITATPSSGSAPLATTLAAVVTDETSMSVNPALNYLWDFGNSTTSTLAAPGPVTYSSAGTYMVTVIVVDDMGASATASKTITVTSSTPLTYPRNLRVLSLNPQPRLTMSFQWDAVVGADGYWLEVTCVQCPGPIDWVVSGTTATVNIPNANTQYTTRIRARTAGTTQWGDWSPTIKAKSDK